MKTGTVILLLVLPGLVLAQYKKAEKLYQRQKFVECIRIAEKHKKKDKLAYEVLLTKAYTGLYLSDTSKNTKALETAMGLYRGLHKNKNATPLINHNQVFRACLINRANYFYGSNKKSQAKSYAGYLASTLKDTITCYLDLYPPITPVAVKESPAKAEEKKTDENSLRKKIVQSGDQFLGIPYKWAGTDSSGLDCSGFVMKTMSKCGIKLMHSATELSKLGKEVNTTECKPGDLVFFGSRSESGKHKIQHVGMVHHIEANQVYIIHCTNQGVIVQSFDKDSYWGRRLLFYKNILDTV